MPTTYTAIATTTVTAASVTDVTFSSIPQTYTDLRLLGSIRVSFNGTYGSGTFTFNGGGQGNVYDVMRLLGTGSGAYAGADSNVSYGFLATSNAAQNTASIFTSVDMYIPNYTGSNNKMWTTLSAHENNATEAYVSLDCGILRNSSAITSLKIYDTTGGMGNILQHSTFTLYGIKNS